MKLTDVSRDVRTIEDFLRTVMLPIIKKEHGIKQELEHKISDADGTSETIKRSCRVSDFFYFQSHLIGGDTFE